jgi:hypothetical protein
MTGDGPVNMVHLEDVGVPLSKHRISILLKVVKLLSVRKALKIPWWDAFKSSPCFIEGNEILLTLVKEVTHINERKGHSQPHS